MCCCSPFLTSPTAPITSNIVSVFILIVSISRSLYLENFSVVFMEMFLSYGTAISMTLQLLFVWSLITISGLVAAISPSVCICTSQSIEDFLLFSVTVAVHVHITGSIQECCSANMLSNVYMPLPCCV